MLPNSIRTIFSLALAITLVALPTLLAAEELSKGEAVYRAQCMSCHGLDGQGTRDKYNEPLAGDLSITELAKVIDETMPEGEPERCSAADAAAVAEYIHQAFYSEVARERLRPARIELARLTVAQYRNAVADLFATDRAASVFQAPHGLKAEYFDARNSKRDKRIIERIDAQVDFDFGAGRPDDENFHDTSMMARWEGALVPTTTGDYELCVETENATRLWVNNDRVPIIDAWVRSGDDRNFRTSLFMIAGRAYPLRLELLNARELTTSVKLKWTPPHGSQQVIPAHHLRAARTPEILTVSTHFPPDDSSAGYARGNAISKEWDAATTEAALEVADQVIGQLERLSGVKADAGDRIDKLKAFAARTLARAWCRPITDSERAVFIERMFETAPTPEVAIKRVLLVGLKSPSFLFREVGPAGQSGEQSDWAVAARLSYSLWDSLPDDELVRVAASGQLHEPDQIAAQAGRMLSDPRTKAKFREFMLHWLKLDTDLELSKDPMSLPQFSPQVINDLRTSLELFLDETVWSPRSDFRELLQADYVWMNRGLAEIYAPDYAAAQRNRLGDEFVKVPCGVDRSGVLTHPYLMATFAYNKTSSPIHRGLYVARNLLGRAIKAPPVAITPEAPDLQPELTTRERVSLQTKAAFCQSCHSMINSLGFGLEHFDAIGRLRAEEKGKPIDASGSYRDKSGKLTTFSGSRELANYLVSSPEVQTAFVTQLFQHLTKQPPAAYGADTLPELRQKFVENDFNIRKLIIDIMRLSALRGVELHTEGLARS